MPAFRYKAARGDGQVIEGTLQAADRAGAARQLQAQGNVPLQIDSGALTAPGVTPGHSTPNTPRVGGATVDFFTLELSTLLQAGLPLAQALDTLAGLAEEHEVLESQRNDLEARGSELQGQLASSQQESQRLQRSAEQIATDLRARLETVTSGLETAEAADRRTSGCGENDVYGAPYSTPGGSSRQSAPGARPRRAADPGSACSASSATGDWRPTIDSGGKGAAHAPER